MLQSKPIRVAFLTQTDPQGASARLRVYALLPYLRDLGLEVGVFPASGGSSSLHYLKIAAQRSLQAPRILRHFDVVVIQRDFINHMKPWLERIYCSSSTPVVFDVDDAIDLRPPGYPMNWRTRLLGCDDKLLKLAGMASAMVVGNSVLAARVKPLNNKTYVLPTALDLSESQDPVFRAQPKATPVIGWIGSPLTTAYLEPLRPVFARLAESHDFVFRTIGAASLDWPDVPLDQRPWTRETADAEVHDFDIGIMPLSDDEWSRNKCGTKIIQYFASCVPVIASPVGMNTEALDNGRAGLLATTNEDWHRQLNLLLTDHKLYRQLSEAGRLQAEAKYDVRVQAKVWLKIISELVT